MSIYSEAAQIEASEKLRSEILKEMSMKGYTFSSFSKKAGINRGILSTFLMGVRQKQFLSDYWIKWEKRLVVRKDGSIRPMCRSASMKVRLIGDE